MTDNTTSTDAGLDASEQRNAVRERYTSIAAESSSCCGGDVSTERSRDIGYSDDDLETVDSDAYLGLGCGNPTAIASLTEGETVLDLGSGGGFDCFLAAQEVGDSGRVIGVDMTPEMVEKARENIEKNDVTNVEFRLGEIEHLPVADATVDVLMSNCVVNLSPDKPQVFREAYRVLRPGGRLAISDNVLTSELPPDVRTDPDAVAACIGGASPIPELESMLSDAGFTNVSVEPKEDREAATAGDDEHELADYAVSAMIEGTKPST